ncbi:MAG: hypothetical protein RR576_09515 [Oscillospiraceae bacterium]
MSNSPYHQLDRLIDEYEEDSRIIKTDKLIMVNYPKVYVMTVASTFERQIKQRCQDFIDFPLIPLAEYPVVSGIVPYCIRNNKPITDGMYGKFYTLHRTTNTINLEATQFYDFFGGIEFKNKVEIIFNTELGHRIEKYQKIVGGLLPLLDSGEQYEREYAKCIDIRDRLANCTFATAEKAFLELKLRRNKVAHDYINGLSDSFEDIRDFYLDAVLYVVAIEKAIVNLTDINAVP